jgi:hypothetical protein
VHYNEIEDSGFRSLKEGERVIYEPGAGGEQPSTEGSAGRMDADPRSEMLVFSGVRGRVLLRSSLPASNSKLQQR